ncbi:MAG TPA: alpha/beta hydrolase [Acidimicrobiia bacterium]
MADYVPTRKGPIHQADYGGDGPSLVLVHGLGGSTTNWIAVAPALSRLGRVRAIDLPGFGLTPPRGDFRLETHRDSIIAYLEELGPGATHTLMGNSTGGLLAEMVAAERPDLVDRLVLVSPATPPRVPDPQLHWPTAIRLAVQATPGLGEAYGRYFLRRNTPEQLTRKTLEMVTHKPGRVPMEVIEASRDMAAIRKHLPWAQYATARTATSIARHYARPNFFVEMIRRIEAPTLVVQGSSDHIVSPTAVEWMCATRADWDLVQMDDTGHTPQMDAPLRFLEVVTSWLAGVESRAVGV